MNDRANIEARNLRQHDGSEDVQIGGIPTK
jgi:hypothetical protein